MSTDRKIISSISSELYLLNGFSVFLLSTQTGIYYAWMSPNTARLLSDKSPIPCTTSDISWLASLGSIGSVLGAILGSILVEYIGSRRTVLVTFLLISFSWICILSANSIVWLYAARIIGGLPASMICCCFSVYLSEISAPDIRGTLISLAMIGFPFGNLFGLVAETYLPQNISSLIYLSVILIGISLLVCLRDSPYYLVEKGDIENAKKSIMLYRRHIKIENELKEIRAFAENSDTGIREKLLQLRLPAVKRALFILVIVFIFPDASGLLTIQFYTEIILETSGFDFVEPEQWVIYSYVVSVMFSCLTVKVLNKFGRRFAMAISSIGTAVALTVLGLQFYLLQSGSDIKSLQWLSVSSLLLYSISYNIGYVTVPSTLLSELFPENIKSIAACLGNLTGSFIGFIVVKSYQPVVDWVGEAYIFWIHALLSILGVPCAVFIVMETKGKTFQQIQDELQKK